MLVHSLQESTIDVIQQNYLMSPFPWILGFSGGKDSSALLKLLFVALQRMDKRPKPVTVLYCDTGVEIPIVRSLALKTLNGIAKEAKLNDIPVLVKIVYPGMKNRFFVKVIGRGYPPPTNKFRWCTDRLRINPVKRFLNDEIDGKSIVLLGIRRGESLERDKTISRHKMKEKYYFRQSENPNAEIFSPIVEYSTEDIWTTLVVLSEPQSININRLLKLYKDASGECPIIRDPKGIPCGKGRFGCWTCTVVRRDRAVESMTNRGYNQMIPLLNFRNWLMEIRENTSYRCRTHRNNKPGLGPFTLTARKEILKRLFKTQTQSQLKLITEEELNLIYEFWEEDKRSVYYQET